MDRNLYYMNCSKHPTSKFYLAKDKKRGDRWRCKACNVEKVSETRRRLKRAVVDALGGSCICCGYNRCIAALEFHHIDPTQKEFALSHANTKSLDRLLVEAKKCILVCAVCHREIEAGVRAYPVGIEPTTIA